MATLWCMEGSVAKPLCPKCYDFRLWASNDFGNFLYRKWEPGKHQTEENTVKDVWTSRYIFHPRYKHYPCLADIETAAEIGCHLCKLITTYCRNYRAQNIDVNATVLIGIEWTHHRNLIAARPLAEYTLITIGLDYTSERQYHDRQDDISEAKSSDQRKRHRFPPIGYHEDSNKFPSAVFDMLRACATTCRETHSRCNIRTLKDRPSRLVDVSEYETGSVRLILAHENTTGEYATLSHCWGKQVDLMFQTTNANLNKCLEAIRIQDLPATFRDAIRVTRELGLQYLWIDSLCIIQDDKADWEREASKMAGIYSNGFVNLAATSSKDGAGGLLYDRSELVVTPMVWEELGVVFHPLFHRHALMFYSTFSSYPLTSRAWVLQESMLSRRMIHFTTGQTVWDCLENRCTEREHTDQTFDRNRDIDYRDNVWSLNNVRGELAARLASTDGSQSSSQTSAKTYHMWYELISDYTRREVTYPDDRFPAIWSLAQSFQLMTGDDYCCGLWKSDLIDGLMFSRGEHSIRAPSTQGLKSTTLAPSWSWAAEEGAVTFYGLSFFGREELETGDMRRCFSSLSDYHGTAAVHSLDIEPIREVPMGRSKRACLTLKTLISRIRLKSMQQALADDNLNQTNAQGSPAPFGDSSQPPEAGNEGSVDSSQNSTAPKAEEKLKLSGWVSCRGFKVIFDNLALAEAFWGEEVTFVHLAGGIALMVTQASPALLTARRIGLCRAEYGTIMLPSVEDELQWENGLITLV